MPRLNVIGVANDHAGASAAAGLLDQAAVERANDGRKLSLHSSQTDVQQVMSPTAREECWDEGNQSLDAGGRGADRRHPMKDGRNSERNGG